MRGSVGIAGGPPWFFEVLGDDLAISRLAQCSQASSLHHFGDRAKIAAPSSVPGTLHSSCRQWLGRPFFAARDTMTVWEGVWVYRTGAKLLNEFNETGGRGGM